MTSLEHEAILSDGAERFGISKKEYRESMDYASKVRTALRTKNRTGE